MRLQYITMYCSEQYPGKCLISGIKYEKNVMLTTIATVVENSPVCKGVLKWINSEQLAARD